MKTPVLVPALLALAGCDSGGVCTTEYVPAIAVSVQDSVTGANIADSAHGYVLTADYADPLRPQVLDSLGQVVILASGPDQGGIYAVLIDRPGYATWYRAGIQVGEDNCHVDQKALTARMSPAG